MVRLLEAAQDLSGMEMEKNMGGYDGPTLSRAPEIGMASSVQVQSTWIAWCGKQGITGWQVGIGFREREMESHRKGWNNGWNNERENEWVG